MTPKYKGKHTAATDPIAHNLSYDITLQGYKFELHTFSWYTASIISLLNHSSFFYFRKLNVFSFSQQLLDKLSVGHLTFLDHFDMTKWYLEWIDRIANGSDWIRLDPKKLK